MTVKIDYVKIQIDCLFHKDDLMGFWKQLYLRFTGSAILNVCQYNRIHLWHLLLSKNQEEQVWECVWRFWTEHVSTQESSPPRSSMCVEDAREWIKGGLQVRQPENLSCHIRAPLLLHEVSEKWMGWGMVCLLQQKCGFMSKYQGG